MSYGISQYGIGTYGGVTPDLSISSARPLSTNVLRVVLTKEPQNISAVLTGDVYNVRTWKITRLDTGVGFNILEITIGEFPLEWDIRVLEKFASSNIEHRVESSTLLDSGGSIIDAPRQSSFFGLLSNDAATPNMVAAARKFSVRDINNPPVPQGTNPGGVFTQGPDRDYQLHEGADFIHKLIFRRMETPPGGFSHLPQYGLGLRLKEPLPAGDLIALQKSITTQLLLEPEIDRLRVSLTQDQNALTIIIRARLKPSGQQIAFPMRIPFGVQF